MALVSGILLVFSSGCEDLTRPPYGDGESPTPPVEDSFPPISESSIAYYRAYPDHRRARSRYVLDTTDVFELQYLSPADGFEAYPGTYVRLDSVKIIFEFDGWPGGDGEAFGNFGGDTLHVLYDDVLYINAGPPFENGTYVRR